MNIGIFGDSFAPKLANETVWWKVLRKFGHTTKSFGDPGSSILFSARLLEQHASSFDFNIWCLTCLGRFSVKVNSEWFHTSGFVDVTQPHKQKIVEAAKSYHQYLQDYSDEIFTAKAIVDYVCKKVNNVMIVPCFSPPVYVQAHNVGFNLFELSERESRYYFPNLSLTEIMQKYHDLRIAHLSTVNNEILATLIAQNLIPGIFSTEYDNFAKPSETLEEMFELQ